MCLLAKPLYKYVYAGCGASQYSTLTRTRTHLNLRVVLGPKPIPTEAGFYPTHCGYFLRVPIGPGSNCHP